MELRIFVEPQQGATYDDQLAVALKAEELGFGAFFRSDHYLSMGVDRLPGPTDSWVTLAGLARETSTIRLGTMMTSATFRHPGPLAISVAQVDHMSGGRVELGMPSWAPSASTSRSSTCTTLTTSTCSPPRGSPPGRATRRLAGEAHTLRGASCET